MSDVRLATYASGASSKPAFLKRIYSAFSVTYGSFSLLVALMDFTSIVASSLLAHLLYHAIAYHSPFDFSNALAVGTNSGIVFILAAKSRGLYQIANIISATRSTPAILQSWLIGLLAFSSLLFLLKSSQDYSRGGILLFAVVELGVLLTARAVAGNLLRDWLQSGKLSGWRTVLIGNPDELERIAPYNLLAAYGTRELARFELSDNSRPEAAAYDRQVIDNAIRFARDNRIQKVMLALPWADNWRRQIATEQLRLLPLPVLLLPDRVANSVLLPPLLRSGPQLAVELSRAPLSLGELFLKRSVDLCIASVALLLLSPLLALVALAIKLSSAGPVLFVQDRMGFNGRAFKIYKFRTMTVMENGDSVQQAKQNDRRVTRIGRILRASSFDELPQLLNVLRGDMSIIGPRPHALAHHNKYEKSIATYAFRHNVRPGITGWAQVNGLRGETPRLEMMARRVEFDLWYIANWSFWLDLQILLRTCYEVVRARNAF